LPQQLLLGTLQWHRDQPVYSLKNLILSAIHAHGAVMFAVSVLLILAISILKIVPVISDMALFIHTGIVAILHWNRAGQLGDTSLE
jgi:hypothetical protein